MTQFYRRIMLATSLLLTTATAAAADQPDFTGVWEAYSAQRGSASPMTENARKMLADFQAQFGDDYVEPGSFCVPPGLVGIMTAMVSYPVEVIHSRDRITMLTEYDMQVRRIFMDGREIPDNYPPTRMGYSVGHWEGEQLVIETGLISEHLVGNWAATEDTHVTERIYMTTVDEAGAEFTGFVQPAGYSDDVLVFELTVEDPNLWAQPQEITMYYQRIPEDSFLEYNCPADLWRRALDGELNYTFTE